MNKREYAEIISKAIANSEVQEMTKTNGVKYMAVVIRSGNVGANVYIDGMYDEELPVEEAIVRVKEIAERSKGTMDKIAGNVDFIMDYEQVKPLLRARLLNAKDNSFEVYRSAKSRGFDDLIIVPYISVPELQGAIRVKEEMLDKWGVTKRSVIDAAIKNSMAESKITDMMDTLAQMMGVTREEALERIGGQPDDTPDQIIVSTDNNTYGAIGILGKLDYLKKRFGKFYVLPSSVHEVIVVPDNGMIDRNSLTRMVKKVNATTVADDEILGSKAYAFI